MDTEQSIIYSRRQLVEDLGVIPWTKSDDFFKSSKSALTTLPSTHTHTHTHTNIPKKCGIYFFKLLTTTQLVKLLFHTERKASIRLMTILIVDRDKVSEAAMRLSSGPLASHQTTSPTSREIQKNITEKSKTFHQKSKKMVE